MNLEQAFWEARWREGRIGFHEGVANAELQRDWPRLNLPPGAGVLVPLCGKSRDLIWLAERGHRVAGVEFSELAVAAFFAEAGLSPRRARIAGLDVWSADALTLICSDFFALTAESLAAACGGVAPEAWWDRAALVALPPPTRRAYAQSLARLLPPGARGLLLSYEYDQAQMPGPPFAVNEPEVLDLFRPPAFTPPELLRRTEHEISEERRALGVRRLQDALWRLDRILAPTAADKRGKEKT